MKINIDSQKDETLKKAEDILTTWTSNLSNAKSKI